MVLLDHTFKGILAQEDSMGYLDPEKDKKHFHHIAQRLRPRLMEYLTSENWEIHGPHNQMPYQVYVGPAKYTYLPFSEVYVAIYPTGVFKIDDPGKLSCPRIEDQIPVLKE